MNPSQKKATVHPGHLMIFAGPGSGKTHTIVNRCQRFLLDPGSVVAMVSFTNAAADEMKKRLDQSGGERVLSGTFHRLAKLQLKTSGQSINLISAGEQSALAKRAAQSIGAHTLSVDEAQSVINAHKTLKRHQLTQGADLYQAYQALLTNDVDSVRHDFSDLLKLAVEGMEQGTVKPLPITHLLVDEFQDADPQQLAWVLLHVRHGVEVTVVADDDQSIYGWRHALGYAGLKQFINYAQAGQVTLDVCYRCHSEILEKAYMIVSPIEKRVDKNIRCERGRGGQVELHAFRFPDEELERLSSEIAASPEKWAILTRSNQQSLDVQRALAVAGIPFTTLGSEKSLFDEVAVCIYISVIKTLIHRSRYDLEQVLSWAGIDELQIKALHPALTHYMDQGLLPPVVKSLKAYKVLREQINVWNSLLKNQIASAPELVLYGLRDWMLGETKDKRVRSQIENATALFAALKYPSLSARLTHIEKLTQFKKKNEQLMPGAVVSTIHAAKGLEWPHVWIPFVNHDVLPHKNGDLNEERRLMFVAMTRAISRLVISANVHNSSEFFKQLSAVIKPEVSRQPFLDYSVLG